MPASEDALFAGRPGSLRLFHLIRDYIESLGPVTVVPMKTQVGFSAGRRFAWVWLPQRWVKSRPEQSVTLTFVLDRRLAHKRIAEAVEPWPGVWTHHVVIENERQFGKQVRTWLRKAYEFAGGES